MNPPICIKERERKGSLSLNPALKSLSNENHQPAFPYKYFVCIRVRWG